MIRRTPAQTLHLSLLSCMSPCREPDVQVQSLSTEDDCDRSYWRRRLTCQCLPSRSSDKQLTKISSRGSGNVIQGCSSRAVETGCRLSSILEKGVVHASCWVSTARKFAAFDLAPTAFNSGCSAWFCCDGCIDSVAFGLMTGGRTSASVPQSLFADVFEEA